jgi:hypothetical protein
MVATSLAVCITAAIVYRPEHRRDLLALARRFAPRAANISRGPA